MPGCGLKEKIKRLNTTVGAVMTPELWEALLNGLRFEKEDYISIALGPVAFFGVYAMFYFFLK